MPCQRKRCSDEMSSRHDANREVHSSALDESPPSLTQIAVALHGVWGTRKVARTASTMLCLLTKVPYACLLPFAIKLAYLVPDISAATSTAEEVAIARQHAAGLCAEDLRLVVFAGCRMSARGGTMVVFDVMLAAVVKRLLVCAEASEALSTSEYRSLLAIVEEFIGPPDIVLGRWAVQWSDAVDEFSGDRAAALEWFLEFV